MVFLLCLFSGVVSNFGINEIIAIATPILLSLIHISSGFLWRKPGSRPESGGNPRGRGYPATVPTEPPTDDRGPPALFLPISREKWGPPPGRRGNGALRPEAP